MQALSFLWDKFLEENLQDKYIDSAFKKYSFQKEDQMKNFLELANCIDCLTLDIKSNYHKGHYKVLAAIYLLVGLKTKQIFFNIQYFNDYQSNNPIIYEEPEYVEFFEKFTNFCFEEKEISFFELKNTINYVSLFTPLVLSFNYDNIKNLYNINVDLLVIF